MPTIDFGSAQPLGAAPTGWNYASSDSKVAKERAAAFDGTGNEVASQLHNQRTNVQFELEAATSSNVSVPFSIGDVVNGYLIENFSIRTVRNNFARISGSCHQHNANAHSGTEKSVATGIADFPGYGATDFMGGTAGGNAAVETGEITCGCTHVDEQDGVGNHLVGENSNPRLSAATLWTGVPSADAGSSWDVTESGAATDREGFKKYGVTGEKALAFS